jgi:hypothetical protein
VKDARVLCSFAELALLSFIKIMLALSKSEKIHRYRKDECLNEAIANFDVKLGFGLHVGWAIEVTSINQRVLLGPNSKSTLPTSLQM